MVTRGLGSSYKLVFFFYHPTFFPSPFPLYLLHICGLYLSVGSNLVSKWGHCYTTLCSTCKGSRGMVEGRRSDVFLSFLFFSCEQTWLLSSDSSL